MKKLKIYLDTSVINFLFADDVPEFRRITEEFFELLKKRRFDVFISDVVINEIAKEVAELAEYRQRGCSKTKDGGCLAHCICNGL